MNEKISLTGLDKAKVLAALYNAAKPQGLGFIHYDNKPMTPEKAEEIISGGNTDFDYLKGRVMKVDLSGETLDPYLYDQDNGQGTAKRVIDEIRKGGSVGSAAICAIHTKNTAKSARQAEDWANQKTVIDSNGNPPTITLGGSEFGEKLKKAIEKAKHC